MEEIKLTSIDVCDNKVTYGFTVSDALKKYFSGLPLWVEYPVDELSKIPASVLAVPFVCNVLPIVWVTNSKLYLPELDRDFYECISEVKAGYEKVFPESEFLGEVIPDKVIACETSTNGGVATFFSGGLDSAQTLISHIDENPHLISIWGSDIRYNNQEGWDVVHQGIAETAGRFSLPDVVIRSNFREFDREKVLHQEFSSQLKDGWWHGIKHALALLGHAAPYVYLKKLRKVYIAASNCPANGIVRCASNPYTDNYVRFAGCRVVHDGYEYSRQDKARNVVNFCMETGKRLTLHACWQSQSGSNCCKCEKCYRTMTALIVEGADPGDYGFENTGSAVKNMRTYLIAEKHLSKFLAEKEWHHIQKRMVEKVSDIRRTQYWKDIKWLYKTDFMHFEKVKMPVIYRLRVKLASYKFYQVLSRLKQGLTKR